MLWEFNTINRTLSVVQLPKYDTYSTAETSAEYQGNDLFSGQRWNMACDPHGPAFLTCSVTTAESGQDTRAAGPSFLTSSVTDAESDQDTHILC